MEAYAVLNEDTDIEDFVPPEDVTVDVIHVDITKETDISQKLFTKIIQLQQKLDKTKMLIYTVEEEIKSKLFFFEKRLDSVEVVSAQLEANDE